MHRYCISRTILDVYMHCTVFLMLLNIEYLILADPNLHYLILVYSCRTLTRTFPGTERVEPLASPHILIPFIPCIYHFINPNLLASTRSFQLVCKSSSICLSIGLYTNIHPLQVVIRGDMAPNPNQIFRDLVAYLSAPSVRTDYAIEALKEYILYRRSKGDSLFEVSIGLAELEEQVS